MILHTILRVVGWIATKLIPADTVRDAPRLDYDDALNRATPKPRTGLTEGERDVIDRHINQLAANDETGEFAGLLDPGGDADPSTASPPGTPDLADVTPGLDYLAPGAGAAAKLGFQLANRAIAQGREAAADYCGGVGGFGGFGLKAGDRLAVQIPGGALSTWVIDDTAPDGVREETSADRRAAAEAALRAFGGAGTFTEGIVRHAPSVDGTAAGYRPAGVSAHADFPAASSPPAGQPTSSDAEQLAYVSDNPPSLFDLLRDTKRFVLQFDTDPAARFAMRAYARYCRDDTPDFADKLDDLLDELEARDADQRVAAVLDGKFPRK